MKNYNKILEAVNRGIQLALDDYQDIEPNSSVSSVNDVISVNDDIKRQIWFNEQFVDLGLPSGILWSKYDFGVDSKNKRKMRYPHNWFGTKYKWGELKSHTSANKWNNYKFAGAAGYAHLTKYCTDSNYGWVGYNDGLDQLQPEDDVVTITMGKNFHIPTKEQFEELIQYTVCYWTDNYKGIPNLSGKVFVSDINNKEIFFPKYDEYTLCVFSWSANILNSYPYRAWVLESGKTNPISKMSPSSRVVPMPIRPIYNR